MNTSGRQLVNATIAAARIRQKGILTLFPIGTNYRSARWTDPGPLGRLSDVSGSMGDNMIHFYAARFSYEAGVVVATLGSKRSPREKTRLKERREMKSNGNGCMTNRVLILIAALLCVGCGMPQPIRQPITYPQPISYPIPQPISVPVPQPISFPVPQPISYPMPQPSSGVISLSGSAMQQATVKAALARCTFPFERLKPGLQQAGIGSVRISWQPMDGGSLGWASTAGEVAIKDSISGLQAQRTAILELGHIVDFFYMTPEMRKAVIRIWHPGIPDNHEWFGSTDYWSQNGESYSTLFLWAFTDEEMWFDAGYTHKPSKELASQLRAILLPTTAMK